MPEDTICYRCDKNYQVTWRMHPEGSEEQVWWCKHCIAEFGGREAARKAVLNYLQSPKEE